MNRRQGLHPREIQFETQRETQRDIDNALGNACGIVACCTMIWLLVELVGAMAT